MDSDDYCWDHPDERLRRVCMKCLAEKKPPENPEVWDWSKHGNANGKLADITVNGIPVECDLASEELGFARVVSIIRGMPAKRLIVAGTVKITWIPES